MGRAARTKTSKAAVKHTLKHARSPEGLVVGIEALGLHEAASDDEDLEARAPAPPDTILAWRESAQHRMEEPMAVPTESLTFTEVGEVTVS